MNAASMMNPTSVLTMVLVGYLLAIGLQTLFGAIYTRTGRGMLVTAGNNWTSAYFVLTGLSWIVAVAIATFVTLPLSEVVGKRRGGEVSLFLDVLIILLVIYRTRKQNPREQSNVMTAALSICIVFGSVIGVLLRSHFPPPVS